MKSENTKIWRQKLNYAIALQRVIGQLVYYSQRRYKDTGLILLVVGTQAELKKQKIKLSLVQQDEWEEYFAQYKSALNEISAQISATDKEIDERVYALYGLTEEEIKVIER